MTTPPPIENDPKVAKAKLAAAKAEAKALRPWFKKKRIILPAIIIVIAVFSAVSNGGKDATPSASETSSTESESTETTETEEAAPAEEKVNTIGDVVTDDDTFSFTVNSIECGISSVGSDLLGAEAQGQFCKVNVTVENIGNEAQYMFADSQVLIDDQGREFSPDTGSMIYLEESSDLWASEINPGNSVTGDLLYDVSTDFVADYIELHASAFSGGVQVSLK